MKLPLLLVTAIVSPFIVVSLPISDRARLAVKQRVRLAELRKVNEDALNKELLAVFKRHRVTSFTLKTTDGSFKATVDPQSTFFIPILDETVQSEVDRERVHHFHNDDLNVDVSSELRSPPRRPLNTQTKVQFSQFEQVRPGVNRYWARVIPDESVHVSRRKYAKGKAISQL